MILAKCSTTLLALSLCGSALACSAPTKRQNSPSTANPPSAIEQTSTTQDAEEAGRSFEHATNRLARALYPIVAREPGNLVFSPASVATGLALAYAGARGETATEIAAALDIGVPPAEVDAEVARYWREARAAAKEREINLEVASRLFADEKLPIHEDFLQPPGAEKREIERIDFGNVGKAQLDINAWVSERTHARIPSVIASSDELQDVILALVNALYLKGPWASPFNPAATVSESFWPDERRAITVPMMHAKPSASYFETDDAQWLTLPMSARNPSERGGFRFAVALPKRPGGLAALERTRSDPPAELLESYLESVAVALPRLNLRFRINLGGALRELGIRRATMPEADFTGMSTKRVHIKKVLHEATLAIDEKGIEASAVTTALLVDLTAFVARDLGHSIRLDRPFLFWILGPDKNTTLFRGRIVSPQ